MSSRGPRANTIPRTWLQPRGQQTLPLPFSPSMPMVPSLQTPVLPWRRGEGASRSIADSFPMTASQHRPTCRRDKQASSTPLPKKTVLPSIPINSVASNSIPTSSKQTNQFSALPSTDRRIRTRFNTKNTSGRDNGFHYSVVAFVNIRVSSSMNQLVADYKGEP